MSPPSDCPARITLVRFDEMSAFRPSPSVICPDGSRQTVVWSRGLIDRRLVDDQRCAGSQHVVLLSGRNSSYKAAVKSASAISYRKVYYSDSTNTMHHRKQDGCWEAVRQGFKGLQCPQLFMELRSTAAECYLSYGITQCYLTPDTSKHTPPWPQPDRPVLDLPTPEGWTAELA